MLKMLRLIETEQEVACMVELIKPLLLFSFLRIIAAVDIIKQVIFIHFEANLRIIFTIITYLARISSNELRMFGYRGGGSSGLVLSIRHPFST